MKMQLLNATSHPLALRRKTFPADDDGGDLHGAIKAILDRTRDLTSRYENVLCPEVGLYVIFVCRTITECIYVALVRNDYLSGLYICSSNDGK